MSLHASARLASLNQLPLAAAGGLRAGYVAVALPGSADASVSLLARPRVLPPGATAGAPQGAWGLRLWLNSLGAPAVCPWGRWCCPLAPRLRPLHVVVGAPIPMEINPRPSAEEVAAAHARYVAALGELFDRHKVAAYGEEGRALSLEVW